MSDTNVPPTWTTVRRLAKAGWQDMRAAPETTPNGPWPAARKAAATQSLVATTAF